MMVAGPALQRIHPVVTAIGRITQSRMKYG
jgi:hypothetical protein